MNLERESRPESAPFNHHISFVIPEKEMFVRSQVNLCIIKVRLSRRVCFPESLKPLEVEQHAVATYAVYAGFSLPR